jgi:peroxiredoxin
MKKLLPFILLHLFILTASAQDSVSFTDPAKYAEYLEKLQARVLDTKFPSFRVKTGSTTLSDSSLQGKVVFINFWFAACPPCISEMKGLNQLYETLKGNKDFFFLSFTSDSETVIRHTKAKYNLKYPVIRLDEAECRRLNFNSGFPLSIILNKEGKIQFFSPGGSIDENASTKEIMEVFLPLILAHLE